MTASIEAYTAVTRPCERVGGRIPRPSRLAKPVCKHKIRTAFRMAYLQGKAQARDWKALYHDIRAALINHTEEYGSPIPMASTIGCVACAYVLDRDI